MGIRLVDMDFVGFSGSRKGAPAELVSACANRVRLDAQVCVGCAPGLDAQIRRLRADAKIFNAVDYPGSSYAAKLANRSAALVEYLYGKNAALVTFPMKPCPDGVRPCTAWKSAKGSGTWGTIALAVGKGLTTIIYQEGIVMPDWGSRINSLNDDWAISTAF